MSRFLWFTVYSSSSSTRSSSSSSSSSSSRWQNSSNSNSNSNSSLSMACSGHLAKSITTLTVAINSLRPHLSSVISSNEIYRVPAAAAPILGSQVLGSPVSLPDAAFDFFYFCALRLNNVPTQWTFHRIFVSHYN